MIQRVYEQASAANLHTVVVATDDERIKNHVLDFGGKVVMTSPNHQSGTDRCYEALQLMGETFDVVVNIQGDEPFIQPQQIEKVVACFHRPDIQIATLAKKLEDVQRLHNPNQVKVLFNKNNEALYFSRTPIPYVKGVAPEQWLDHYDYHGHIGIYAYKQQVLEAITQLPPSALEQVESLEQLRWLENGYAIGIEITTLEPMAIDTPDDLQRLLKTMD